MIKLTLSPALNTEVFHYAKMNRLSINEAIEQILKLYLRSRNDND